MEDKNPTCKYSSQVLEMVLHLLLFLRAIQSRNFKLYLISIECMLPWFYSLDHYNYARWLSVHFYNMNMLPHTNPNVNDAFINEGNFVISRTPDAFSAMGIEQCHEQLNELVKGEGGAIGLTEDEDRQKVVCGPEVARIVMKFEEKFSFKAN